MKILFCFSLLLLFQFHIYSQSPSEDYLGSWYTYSGNHRLSEHFSVSPGTQLRYYEPSSNYNLALFYLSGNYHVSQKALLGLGYAYLDIDTVFEFDKEPNVHEHRAYEYYAYKHTFHKIKISHRGQLEQRFLEFNDRTELQNRFRYRIGLKYDINSTFFAVLTEEPFINFQDQAFHENRFYTGIGINILKHSQLQIGYLKQHIRKRSLNRIQIGISIQTDSRKSKNPVVHL